MYGYLGLLQVFGLQVELGKLLQKFIAVSSFIDDDLKDPADKIFSGIPPVFKAGLYHSWAVISKSFPSELRITESYLIEWTIQDILKSIHSREKFVPYLSVQ